LPLIALNLTIMIVPALAGEKRIALVIGNNAYPGAPLVNARNDAELMARALESVGFTVTQRTGLTENELKRAILGRAKSLWLDRLPGLPFIHHRSGEAHGRTIPGKSPPMNQEQVLGQGRVQDGHLGQVSLRHLLRDGGSQDD
jgi:hypothetical protein